MKANLVGKRFGRLVVVEDSGRREHRNIMWRCKCDCGNETFLRSNTLNMGLVRSCGCLVKDIGRAKVENKNVMWKGAHAGLGAVHQWLRKRMERPELCEVCGKRKVQDLANVSGMYTRNISDYKWMCRRCHMIFDDRLDRREPNGRFSVCH